ncbi:MAG: dihydrodipicolinate reductase C-terminal domain-containing protein [Acidobacteriota bacterium]|nr:dihydrodipicolinate reductase C-terminal domain-containing protein [Acidobacteriota bacterium]
MKIALIGRGRTGGLVWQHLSPEERFAAFDRRHPPTPEALAGADAVIVFTPGEAVPQLIPVLTAARTTTFWGSTGHTWPEDLHQRLVAEDIAWIAAANFSPGMVLVRSLIQRLEHAERLLPGLAFTIDETHHTGKRDAPSGTALRWREWLGRDTEMISHREGDVVGRHRLSLATETETIHLEHVAHDRSLFARGAVWAARTFAQQHYPGPGFHRFEDLATRLQEAPA